MIYFGYSLAILIGLALGLLGGGGSILTVPIFVYVLGLEAKVAIASSLAVVGVTSLLGSYSHWREGNINFRIAAIFGVVAMGGTYLGAWLSRYFSGAAQLLLFAVVMAAAAFFMYRNATKKRGESSSEEEDAEASLPYHWIAFEGLGVGVLTGLVGVGGGFMIVPALVLLGRVPMKEAVGTSLLIIAGKSFAGFMGYRSQVEIPWEMLAYFTTLSVIGIFIGAKLVRFVSERQLKKGFSIFLIMMSLVILYKERAAFVSIFG